MDDKFLHPTIFKVIQTPQNGSCGHKISELITQFNFKTLHSVHRNIHPLYPSNEQKKSDFCGKYKQPQGQSPIAKFRSGDQVPSARLDKADKKANCRHWMIADTVRTRRKWDPPRERAKLQPAPAPRMHPLSTYSPASRVPLCVSIPGFGADTPAAHHLAFPAMPLHLRCLQQHRGMLS
jgi:hypothetical protein